MYVKSSSGHIVKMQCIVCGFSEKPCVVFVNCEKQCAVTVKSSL